MFGFAFRTRSIRTAFEKHFSAITFGQSGENPREGGFAGAIAAHQGMDFTAEQLEIEVREDRDVVAFVHARGAQEWGSSGRHRHKFADQRVTRSTVVVWSA